MHARRPLCMRRTFSGVVVNLLVLVAPRSSYKMINRDARVDPGQEGESARPPSFRELASGGRDSGDDAPTPIPRRSTLVKGLSQSLTKEGRWSLPKSPFAAYRAPPGSALNRSEQTCRRRVSIAQPTRPPSIGVPTLKPPAPIATPCHRLSSRR